MDRNPFSILNEASSGREKTPFETLRQFVQKDEELPEMAREHCDLCSVELPPRHRHLLAMDDRRVVCACSACALRFQNVIDGRYKLIPRDAYALPDVVLSDEHWNRLALPINLAFFFYSTPEEKMTVLYPSPGGATESLVPLDAWETIIGENPVLEQMEPDVEALLVNRVDDARACYLAPIDTCYELVGLIRLHWQGFSGGKKVWDEIEGFFDRLERKAKPMAGAPPEAAHA